MKRKPLDSSRQRIDALEQWNAELQEQLRIAIKRYEHAEAMRAIERQQIDKDVAVMHRLSAEMDAKRRADSKRMRQRAARKRAARAKGLK